MNKTRYHLRSDVLTTGGSSRLRWKVDGTSPRTFTEQERRVVAELARGLSNRQIASVMELSEHTIKFHLKNVFTKLGVQSRMQVIVHAVSASPEMSTSRAVSGFNCVYDATGDLVSRRMR